MCWKLQKIHCSQAINGYYHSSQTKKKIDYRFQRSYIFLLHEPIPLTNRVRGPYFKLRTKFFPVDLWPIPSAKRAGHKSTGKKRGSVTYSTDRENEVSKIFIISLRLTGARARKLVKVKRKVQLPQIMPCQNPKN